MKKILFPTDFSTPANNAVLFAVELAKDLDASIDLLYVSDTPLDSTIMISEKETDTQFKLMSDYAQAKMDNLLEKISISQVNGRKIVYGDSVAAKIAKEAKEGDYDLIIMGMKGEHERLDKWLGSVTTNLMIKAPCPVLAIPEKATYEGIRKVALATELPSTKDMPIQQVSAFAKACAAELEFVNVDNIVRKATKYQVGQEKESYFGMEYSIITNPSITDGLNDFVLTNKTDVLSLYSPNRRLWKRLFHFRTSKNMAFHTKIPLLVFQR